MYKNERGATTFICRKKSMIFLIDNGHGADTPGKRSPVWADGGQLREWEFNRDIARRIVSGLALAGIDSALLVTEENDVPLPERVARANRLHRDTPGGAVLISVHANAGGGSGWECFTSPGRSGADILADILCAQAQKTFPDRRMRFESADGDRDKEVGFYILEHTLCPAVLTENFFMDNENDCRLLTSGRGRQKIADLHIEAIKSFNEI
jgi:N-acetylmuramoyl-L-alanine amidase